MTLVRSTDFRPAKEVRTVARMITVEDPPGSGRLFRIRESEAKKRGLAEVKKAKPSTKKREAPNK